MFRNLWEIIREEMPKKGICAPGLTIKDRLRVLQPMRRGDEYGRLYTPRASLALAFTRQIRRIRAGSRGRV